MSTLESRSPGTPERDAEIGYVDAHINRAILRARDAAQVAYKDSRTAKIRGKEGDHELAEDLIEEGLAIDTVCDALLSFITRKLAKEDL